MSIPLRASDPRTVGSYRLHSRLGGGGMGRVYLGRSPGGHTVAVKVVHPDLADDPGFRERFADEVAAARRVGGFYTAQVIDADTDADQPWLATAYIPGPSLYQAVEEHGPLPERSVTALGAGLAEGLSAVHGHKLVHRDLKPANVILATDGPRVIDFGIARALDTTSHTRTNTVLGTAGFMAPEQALAENVSPATDVFALGCVLVYAATGRSPFGTGQSHAVTYRVVHEKPDLSGVPGSLAPLLTNCLAKKPQRRPALDRVLRQLTALAVPDTDRTDGRWLPASITEVIHHLTTAVHTLPPTLHDPDVHRPDSTKKEKVKKKPKRTPSEQTSPKKAPPKNPKPPPKKETNTPKPAKNKTASASSGSTTNSKSGSTKTTKNDDNSFWVFVGIAAAIAGGLYVFHSGFSLWASQWLNAGTDQVEVEDCITYINSQPAEVPCIAAAADYTVAAVRSDAAVQSELTVEDLAADGLPDVCEGAPGWHEDSDISMRVSDHTVCLVPKSQGSAE